MSESDKPAKNLDETRADMGKAELVLREAVAAYSPIYKKEVYSHRDTNILAENLLSGAQRRQPKRARLILEEFLREHGLSDDGKNSQSPEKKRYLEAALAYSLANEAVRKHPENNADDKHVSNLHPLQQALHAAHGSLEEATQAWATALGKDPAELLEETKKIPVATASANLLVVSNSARAEQDHDTRAVDFHRAALAYAQARESANNQKLERTGVSRALASSSRGNTDS